MQRFFIYGLSIADAVDRTGHTRNILLSAPKCTSRGLDKTTRAPTRPCYSATAPRRRARPGAR